MRRMVFFAALPILIVAGCIGQRTIGVVLRLPEPDDVLLMKAIIESDQFTDGKARAFMVSQISFSDIIELLEPAIPETETPAINAVAEFEVHTKFDHISYFIFNPNDDELLFWVSSRKPQRGLYRGGKVEKLWEVLEDASAKANKDILYPSYDPRPRIGPLP